MQGHGWKVMVGAALVASACREDGGTGPAAVSYAVSVTAQCVASHSGVTATGPSIVQSRLAPFLAADGHGGDITGPPADLVCLSQEGGRWRIGRLAEAVP